METTEAICIQGFRRGCGKSADFSIVRRLLHVGGAYQQTAGVSPQSTAAVMGFGAVVPREHGIIPQLNTLRSLAVCVWVMTVGSVLGQHGTCRFTPDTSSLSCPCFPTAAQSLHLHDKGGPFRDVCTRGEGNRLCCQNTSQARADADHVILNYSWVIPRTIYCEIGFGTSVMLGVGVPVALVLILWRQRQEMCRRMLV
ncbi:uncharacterized protein LOC134350892 isoform X2 [Mobula hypostoma]|uniref:uncharacterized protein LOC134350892 isoform X2 n=1 Tax=Mobula hypostoma TaxID=723540 RepID=UPI002FC33A3C